MDLVIGVDAGGTSTRCLVAGVAGQPVGSGAAAGLNQRSSGGDPVDRLTRAVAEALGGNDPTAVRAGVLGVAGAGAAGLTLMERQAVEAWRRLGLGGVPVVVPDLLAAFAAGTPEPSGTVLVAGTGAGSAAVDDRRVVAQADGVGWVLGDVGSAVWLAREALVAAVAALDGRGPATALSDVLLARLLGGSGVPGARREPSEPNVQDVIARVYAVSPATLGALAPAVTEAADAGDEVARDIVRRGITGLLTSLDAVRPAVSGSAGRGPVVLAGALLTNPGPVLAGVSGGLSERGLPTPRCAERPAAGAAWLALASLGVTDEAVHATLTGDS